MSGRGITAAGLGGAVQRGTAASGLRGAVASGRRGAVAKPQGDVWATSEGRNNLRTTTSGRRGTAAAGLGGAEQRGTAREAEEQQRINVRCDLRGAARNSAKQRDAVWATRLDGVGLRDAVWTTRLDGAEQRQVWATQSSGVWGGREQR